MLLLKLVFCRVPEIVWLLPSLASFRIFSSESVCQGWAGMTFEGSGTGRELKKPISDIREREGNWKSPFPKFGNGKGIKKSIPKFRECEGNEKIPFPKFGNRKGMKKIHSKKLGMGREWKNPFPKFGKGNQRPPFLTGNGNSRSPLVFWLRSSPLIIHMKLQKKNYEEAVEVARSPNVTTKIRIKADCRLHVLNVWPQITIFGQYLVWTRHQKRTNRL